MLFHVEGGVSPRRYAELGDVSSFAEVTRGWREDSALDLVLGEWTGWPSR